jgi:hypothetical protein
MMSLYIKQNIKSLLIETFDHVLELENVEINVSDVISSNKLSPVKEAIEFNQCRDYVLLERHLSISAENFLGAKKHIHHKRVERILKH